MGIAGQSPPVVQKFFEYYGTQWLITIFTRARRFDPEPN